MKAIHHVGITVPDLDRVTDFYNGSVDAGVLAGWRWVYFRDPFGIVLEQVEIAYTPES